MQLIGLTGGIASGKSVVAARLAERGAVVVDADKLAREVVEPGTPALAAIARHFGPRVIRGDGSLDRAELGAIVFADETQREALNAITHPAVGARARQLFDAAGRADPEAVVVYDVPLLVESGADRASQFDRVVVVHADAETRVDRLVHLRGMTEAEARSRVAAQATDEQRLAIADVVIDSSGSLEQTLEQADAFWRTLAQYGAAPQR
ncbi:dephospho-CoA kinase [Glaciihabitans tibetensis]|uniref:Dephospho-CoA kinase n=1 Tax=Glaciihabitans tibetensis TaxID=1266600 RepID=A0A2T0VJL2_9MICO|nr:dephospho-CoA kinase [Glaciihabitans tibetensis]PRY70421.1 dephospho-CoA kinase [Glaciihabitans tibetensis]